MLHSVIALFRQNTDYLWEPSQKAALKRNPFPLAGALLAILARYQTLQPAYALSQYRRNRRKRLVRKTLSKAPEVAKNTSLQTFGQNDAIETLEATVGETPGPQATDHQ